MMKLMPDLKERLINLAMRVGRPGEEALTEAWRWYVAGASRIPPGASVSYTKAMVDTRPPLTVLDPMADPLVWRDFASNWWRHSKES